MDNVEAIGALLREMPAAQFAISIYDDCARNEGKPRATAEEIVGALCMDEEDAFLIEDAWQMLDALQDAERQVLGFASVLLPIPAVVLAARETTEAPRFEELAARPPVFVADLSTRQRENADTVRSLQARGLLDLASLSAKELLGLAEFVHEGI